MKVYRSVEQKNQVAKTFFLIIFFYIVNFACFAASFHEQTATFVSLSLVVLALIRTPNLETYKEGLVLTTVLQSKGGFESGTSPTGEIRV